MTEELSPEAKKEMSEEDKEELEMETGKKDEDLETDEGREAQLEDDAIDPGEEGFMKGEEQADDYSKDKEEKKEE